MFREVSHGNTGHLSSGESARIKYFFPYGVLGEGYGLERRYFKKVCLASGSITAVFFVTIVFCIVFIPWVLLAIPPLFAVIFYHGIVKPTRRKSIVTVARPEFQFWAFFRHGAARIHPLVSVFFGLGSLAFSAVTIRAVWVLGDGIFLVPSLFFLLAFAFYCYALAYRLICGRNNGTSTGTRSDTSDTS